MKFTDTFLNIKNEVLIRTGHPPWKILISSRIAYETQHEIMFNSLAHVPVGPLSNFTFHGINFEIDTKLVDTNACILYNSGITSFASPTAPYQSLSQQTQLFNFENIRLGKGMFQVSKHLQFFPARFSSSLSSQQLGNQPPLIYIDVDTHEKLIPVSEKNKQCVHSWKEYIGFTRRDFYCVSCNTKRDEV